MSTEVGEMSQQDVFSLNRLGNVLKNISKDKWNEKLFGDILWELDELVIEIDACNNIDDVISQSVYVESELWDVIFNILKAYSEINHKEVDQNINFNKKPDRVFQDGENVFSCLKNKLLSLQVKSSYTEQDLDEIIWLILMMFDELQRSWYIQCDLRTILWDVQKKFIRRYEGIKRWELSLEDKRQNDVRWEDCKKIEKDEKEEKSAKRKLEYEKGSNINKVLRSLDLDKITLEPIESLDNIDKQTTVVVLQKFASKEVLNLLTRMWLETTFSRKGFLSIKLKNGEKVVFIKSKDIDSTQGFTDVEKYAKDVFYIWWSDMVRKYQAMNWEDSLISLSNIDWELFFWTKTELLPLMDKKSVDLMVGWDFPNVVATKFKAIISEKAIKELGKIKKLYSIDSNSEALLQILRLKHPEAVISGVEIVQSWASVEDTHNYMLREESEKIVIYKPTTRNPWSDFSTEDIYKVISKPDSKLLNFVKTIQTNIDVELCQVNKETKDKVNEILNTTDEKSVKTFLINLMNLREKELAQFKKIKTC